MGKCVFCSHTNLRKQDGWNHGLISFSFCLSYDRALDKDERKDQEDSDREH